MKNCLVLRTLLFPVEVLVYLLSRARCSLLLEHEAGVLIPGRTVAEALPSVRVLHQRQTGGAVCV